MLILRSVLDSSFDGVFQTTTLLGGPGSRTPHLQAVEWSNNIGVPDIRRCYVRQGVKRTLPDFHATVTTANAAYTSRPSHEEAKELPCCIVDDDDSTEVPYYVGGPFSEALDGIVQCGATVQEAFRSIDVPGITEPCWYVGSHIQGSCLHAEDGGLRSMNVMFSGFKILISVPADGEEWPILASMRLGRNIFQGSCVYEHEGMLILRSLAENHTVEAASFRQDRPTSLGVFSETRLVGALQQAGQRVCMAP
ncbi:unnamed protein product [Clonostachys rosea]|uniref:Uncharacterized protein n=1 Tax=Bionectria ochroleuca TaxID=29856 RepID=A0ABY6UFF2_BIOOC|nr:unnamed protein product [Clonostachys rosea]